MYKNEQVVSRESLGDSGASCCS